MDETAIISQLMSAIIGGLGIFFTYVDWGFFTAILVLMFLSNLLFPPKEEMPKFLRWTAMHRYRVPVIALCTAMVFAAFRDYGTFSRTLWFTYTMTMVFSMSFNMWFLDKPAANLAVKYPSMKLLLKGAEPDPPKC